MPISVLPTQPAGTFKHKAQKLGAIPEDKAVTFKITRSWMRQHNIRQMMMTERVSQVNTMRNNTGLSKEGLKMLKEINKK